MTADTTDSNASPYDRLRAVFARRAALSDALGTLHWDSEAMMPNGAADRRAQSLATLRVLAHDMLSAPAVAEDLQAAEAEADRLASWDRANLAEMRRVHSHETAVPADLVAANSRAVSASEMAWRDARRNADFKTLKPHLQTVLDRQRDIGAAVGAALDLPLYDALLDQHDPGMRAGVIDPIFDDLADYVPGVLSSVLEAQGAAAPPPVPAGPFPQADQTALAERMMTALGFDFDRGRLDVSLHPFCGGSTEDVRITTRYDEDDYTVALMGVLHETGHALYEQGRPTGWLDQPVGDARGMTLHESQSLFIEMQISRSRAFQAFLRPHLVDAFGGEKAANRDVGEPDVPDPDALYRRAVRVEPGFIRVDADEVTYPLHVILRYRLEQAMLAGDLTLGDLPGAWNDGMRDLLGLTPPDDAMGCLQDIHWPAGIWGYFPTYTLGALAAAQFAEAADKALHQSAGAGIATLVADGRFTPIVDWLHTNVHALGASASTGDILERATGRPLDSAAFKTHLQKRYIGGA